MAKERGPGSKALEKLERGFFLLLLLLVTWYFLDLLKPFFAAIFWACIIGLLFQPLYQRLLKLWKGRANVSAIAALLIVLFIGIIPLLFLITLFIEEGTEVYRRLQSGEIDVEGYLNRLKAALPVAQRFLENLNVDLSNLKEQLSSVAVAASRYLAQHTLAIGQGTLKFFVDFGIMLYLAFFMLRDGSMLVDLIARALPLGDQREKLLFAKFVDVTRATVKGNLVVAAVQGALGGLIFWILGIPAPVLWGVVMAFLSLLPVVGASLVWIPAAIYLFVIGSWIKALVLIGFSAGIISLIDNLLRPLLVGRGTKLPDYIVLLSTLGGFVLFGMNGFVIGPLLAALFVAFWEIFTREFNTSRVSS